MRSTAIGALQYTHACASANQGGRTIRSEKCQGKRMKAGPVGDSGRQVIRRYREDCVGLILAPDALRKRFSQGRG